MTESNGKTNGKYWEDLPEEEREQFIQDARKRLPALDAQFAEGKEKLDRWIQHLRSVAR